MNKSEKINNLTKALHKFQSEVSKIRKDAKNPHFKSNYASLSSILDAVIPVLSECGLVITSHPHEGSLITTLFHSESGEFMESSYPLTARDMSNPQQIGSAISYARRYSVSSILNLNINDDDGNYATNGPAPAVTTNSDTPKQKVTLKSKKWKEVEKKIIDMLKEGFTADSIIKNAESNWDLSDEVKQFIRDNEPA